MTKLDVRREAFARQGTQLSVLGRTLRIAGSPGKAVFEMGAEGRFILQPTILPETNTALSAFGNLTISAAIAQRNLSP
jgi:hypothetical protein